MLNILSITNQFQNTWHFLLLILTIDTCVNMCIQYFHIVNSISSGSFNSILVIICCCLFLSDGLTCRWNFIEKKIWNYLCIASEYGKENTEDCNNRLNEICMKISNWSMWMDNKFIGLSNVFQQNWFILCFDCGFYVNGASWYENFNGEIVATMFFFILYPLFVVWRIKNRNSIKWLNLPFLIFYSLLFCFHTMYWYL